MSCVFTYLSTVVTVKDHMGPFGVEKAPRQRRTVSGGGAIRVSTLGESDHVLRLRFTRMPNADWAALEAFIEDTVSHGATAFTFTDSLSVSHANVRYVGGKESFKRRPKGGVWDGELLLQKDLGA